MTGTGSATEAGPAADRPAAAPRFPDGWGLVPTDDLRTRSNGRVLIGGAPLKILRLSRRGAELTKAWFGGQPISDRPAHHFLARKLVDTGMANPRSADRPAGGAPGRDPAPDAATVRLTVVVPVKDDPKGLTETLDGLVSAGSRSPHLPVVVVDDGSRRPVVAVRPGVTVVRTERSAGPGGARQRGLAAVTTPLVAFVDAGVVAAADDLHRLAETLDDEALVAAAARVASSEATHTVARYEARRSPLDMGPVESLVGPGRMVPYVPTACLLARVAAIEEAGGFDPALRYGEDVDLVWRLSKLGAVRYRPDLIVRHPARATVAAMAAQRRHYGSSAAGLAARHGDAVAPCSLSPWSILVVGLVAAGHPAVGLTAAAGTAIALRPKIEPLPDVTVEAFLLTARGHWYAGLSLLTALARTWSPAALALAVLVPRWRRRLGILLTTAFCRRLIDGPRRPASAASDLALGAVDDLSYAAGVWQGCVTGRSVRALLPALRAWPRSAERG